MPTVCHVTSAHNSSDNRIFRKECRSLAETGYTVYLVAPGESRVEDGIEIIGTGAKATSRFGRMTDGASNVVQRALELNADLYHLHDPELLLHALQFKKKKKFVVFDAHENYAEQIRIKKYIPRQFRGSVSRMYEFIESVILKKIDGVVFTGLVNGANPYKNKCKRSVLINNSAIAADFRDVSNLDFSSKKFICCTGSLSRDRGITQLVIASYRADVPLLLCGPIADSYLSDLSEMKEFETVKYLGMLPFEEVKKVISSSFLGSAVTLDVGQYYSADNLATKTTEYMLSGIPVLINDSQYNRSLLEKTVFGRSIKAENLENYAAAIKFYKNHLSEASLHGNNGRKLALDCFSWESEAPKLFSFYESIFKQK